jgi:ribosome-associated toxin RatA of RatAB toxin-antitoxin module
MPGSKNKRKTTMSQHIKKIGEIGAPVEKVYWVVAHVTTYPEFLPGVKKVEQLEGDIVEMTVDFELNLRVPGISQIAAKAIDSCPSGT